MVLFKSGNVNKL